jgi:type I restriction enzyme M protein
LKSIEIGDKPKAIIDRLSEDLLERIVDRYFAEQQREIDKLQSDLDGITQELEALVEEHSGEEGALNDAQTDAGKVTKASLMARLKEIKGDNSAIEERDIEAMSGANRW